MIPQARYLLAEVAIGVGATVCIDLWALVLKRAFGIPSLNLCFLGRWILYMPEGTFAHERIAATPAKRHECAVGWASHYFIGVTFAVAFVLVMSTRWLEHPTLTPALLFGLLTAAVPLFVMQPALGLGVASSKTPNPSFTRIKSLVTHLVFGAGLYLSARLGISLTS